MKQILLLQKRSFSITSLNRSDPNNILNRIEELLARNKELSETTKSTFLSDKVINSIKEEILDRKTKRQEENRSMIDYLKSNSSKCKLTREEHETLLSDSKKLTEVLNLYDLKLAKLDINNPASLKEMINLDRIKSISGRRTQDKHELTINGAIERLITEGKMSEEKQLEYLAFRAKRLKERKDFSEEEEAFLSKARETPMDFAMSFFETSMPSYTDPED